MISLAVLGWLAPPPHVAQRRSGSISMLKDSYDLVVLGGGPVGITGALRATSLGKSAILVDATPQSQFQFTGPTGLFSKALRDASLRIDVPVLRSMGIGDAAIWAQVRELVDSILRKSGDGNARALSLARIPHLRGFGRLAPSNDGKIAVENMQRWRGVGGFILHQTASGSHVHANLPSGEPCPLLEPAPSTPLV